MPQIFFSAADSIVFLSRVPAPGRSSVPIIERPVSHLCEIKVKCENKDRREREKNVHSRSCAIHRCYSVQFR